MIVGPSSFPIRNLPIPSSCSSSFTMGAGAAVGATTAAAAAVGAGAVVATAAAGAASSVPQAFPTTANSEIVNPIDSQNNLLFTTTRSFE